MLWFEVMTRAAKYHGRIATMTKQVFPRSLDEAIFHLLTSLCRNDGALTRAILILFRI